MSTEIPSQAVRAQVTRILASDAFVRSRRMQRFLEFIVEETLAGRAGQLGEYGIGTAVFDRGQDFEPALDPIVRNDARRLREKLFEYYRHRESGAGDAVVIDVPKGSYVPVFLPSTSRDNSSSTLSGRPPCRLAVFPVDVLSMVPDDVAYSRALCMSLTAALTNLEGLQAVAHGYIRELSIREAASELQLSHALHGSVSKSSDRYRIIINLIHISDGTQLWAHEYDLEGRETMASQSEITRSVLHEVTERLGVGRRQLTLLARAA